MMHAVVTHWRTLLDTEGRTFELDWVQLFDRFERGGEFLGDNHPGWSAARFDPPKRGLENVRQVSAVVLDYDGGETLDAALALWGDYFGLLHTTRKHTPEAPRFRVILPFTRLVSPFEYAAIWRRVNAKAGGKLDPAPKDPSRFWYTPGAIKDGHFETRRLVGPPMDPDTILSLPEPADRRPAPVIPIRRGVVEESIQERRLTRALAYTAKMPAAYSKQGGHNATWAVVVACRGFGLTWDQAYQVLRVFNERCEPPWTDTELRHKLETFEKMAVPEGFKNEDEEEWERKRRRTSEPDSRRDVVDQDGCPVDPGTYPDDEREAIESEAEGSADEVPSAAARFGARSLADLLSGVIKRAELGKVQRGVTTGHWALDEMLGGLRRKRITIIGADTSFGKSSFAIMVAQEAITAGAGVLLLSSEDSEDAYGQRFMARIANLNAFKIRDNELGNGDVQIMRRYLAGASTAPFFVDCIGKTTEHGCAAIRALCKEHEIDLVIVDYIQRFNLQKRTQDQRTKVTEIGYMFSDAIKESNAAGLLLSQLKRPENETKPPTLHDLKESGDLENMAEHVLLGHLERGASSRDDKRYFYIAKNKDGPRNVDKIEMPFSTETASFVTQAPAERPRDSYDDMDDSLDEFNRRSGS